MAEAACSAGAGETKPKAMIAKAVVILECVGFFMGVGFFELNKLAMLALATEVMKNWG